jgi:hypothetical protein
VTTTASGHAERQAALARSTFDLFAIVKRIADAKAQFRSLAELWADTGQHRAVDARRTRRPRRRGTRPDPMNDKTTAPAILA